MTIKRNSLARRFFALILIMALARPNAFACSCDYGGPFLKMAPRASLVALVKVTKFLAFKTIYDHKTPMSMEVEIIDIYKGAENRKTVTVWGDPGNLCRPYLDTFTEGQAYVIAFNPGSPGSGHENEKETDYSISICGAFWLVADLKSQTVSGDINSKDRASQTLSLSRLRPELEINSHK